jgi:hypothetical protein
MVHYLKNLKVFANISGIGCDILNNITDSDSAGHGLHYLMFKLKNDTLST